MNNDYWEITVKINPICADIVCDIFDSNFNCEGIVTAEEEYKDLELIRSSDNIIKAYVLEESINFDDVQSLFAQKRQEIIDLNIFNEDPGSWEVAISKQEIVDWSKKWKENWKPSKISEHIVICPTWEEYNPKDGEIKINLDPGNAFGTGTHPTTQLCVLASEKYMTKNSQIADIGCGSGILAICGLKLGAKSALAIDNDPIAVDTAIENAKINQVSELIEFHAATVDEFKNKQFDFVFANILHNVLAEIMPDLKNILKNDGKIVLSGILNGKEPVVLESLKQNKMIIIEQMQLGDWIAFVVKKEE